MNQANIVYADHEHATGLLGNCLITYSRAEPNRQVLDNWMIQARHLTVGGGRFVGLIIVDSDAKPPSDQIRVEINDALRSLRDGLGAIGYVMEGKGFVAAAKRSAVSMIALLARFPFPMKCFGDVVEGALWLSTQGGPDRLNSKAIVQASESVRAALKSPP